MCCAKDCLRKWNMEKQVCKDMCMKEVSITHYPYTVSIYSFSMVCVPSLSLSGTMPHHTMHMSIRMSRCACIDVQEETIMSRAAVLIVMAGLCG